MVPEMAATGIVPSVDQGAFPGQLTQLGNYLYLETFVAETGNIPGGPLAAAGIGAEEPRSHWGRRSTRESDETAQRVAQYEISQELLLFCSGKVTAGPGGWEYAHRVHPRAGRDPEDSLTVWAGVAVMHGRHAMSRHEPAVSRSALFIFSREPCASAGP